MRALALTALIALPLVGCEDSSSSSGSSQYKGEAQSQLGRTAEMGRNLADKIEARDANIGTAAAQSMGGEGLISIPGLDMSAPPGWASVTPSNSMRLAQFESGESVITVSQAGGSVDANIERWIGQVVDQFGEPVEPRDESDRDAAGYPTTIIETYGAYLEGGMMGTPTRRENYGLVGAVIETPGSTNTFVKMTGPAHEVEDSYEAFERLLDSMRKN